MIVQNLRLRVVVLALLLMLGSMPVSARQQTALPSDIDEYAARVLKEFDVPGMAVAVVKDGKVILAKGYGVREIGKPEPVTADTLFGIASNSKAFTTAALAMLVDEGKIAWDDPVIKHLPTFQLADPYVTREFTIRDLLTHRSGLGLGAGDLMWWPTTTFTRAEVLHNIRYLKPVTSFRSQYAYDNVLYLVAGEVIRAVTGKTWDEFVAERIFKPLGMNRCNTSPTQFRKGDDIARPHAPADGKLRAIEYTNLDNVGPAASINASVNDMTKWMIAQLDGGAYRDASGAEKRLFSLRRQNEMWAQQTILPINPNPPASLAALRPNFYSYGLGWFLQDYRGRKIVSHTGGLAGLVSKVTLVPELKLGVVVLTNQESGAAFSAMSWRIVDSLIGAPQTDWITAYKEVGAAQKRAIDEALAKQGAARAAGSKPALPLAKYAGTYRDPWYGDVTLAFENDKLVMRFSRTAQLVGDLEHWQYDSFIVRWRDRTLNADAYVTFSLNHDGGIERLRMEAVSPTTDFSFDFQDLNLVPVKTDGK